MAFHNQNALDVQMDTMPINLLQHSAIFVQLVINVRIQTIHRRNVQLEPKLLHMVRRNAHHVLLDILVLNLGQYHARGVPLDMNVQMQHKVQ